MWDDGKGRSVACLGSLYREEIRRCRRSDWGDEHDEDETDGEDWRCWKVRDCAPLVQM